MDTTTRKQVTYNRPVGIKDGCLYLVNYTFEDVLGDKPFNGVTGAIMEPITQAQIDEYNEFENVVENVRDLWVEAVKDGRIEEGLEEYTRAIIRDMDDEYFGQDTSDIHYVPEEIASKYFPEAATWNCIGGGRCFEKGMTFDVVLDQFLLDEINRLEEGR